METYFDILSTAMMGWAEPKVSSTEPIDTRIMITMIKARTPFMTIDQNIARGTADFAFLVSSLI